MYNKRPLRLLGLYELLLAVGAIITGVAMINGSGIFSVYPKEWLGKIPFESWASIGILGIMVFGLGNIFAAIASFSRGRTRPWLISLFMGLLLLVGIIYFRILLGEWYLATAQFLILSILQIIFCFYVIYKNRPRIQ